MTGPESSQRYYARITGFARRAEWTKILATERIPIISPVGEVLEMPPLKSRVYFIDKRDFTIEQLEELMRLIACTLAVRVEELQQVVGPGVPIPAEWCTVSWERK